MVMFTTGKVDVGELADPHAEEADRAENDQADHQHPGKDGFLDGNIGKCHGCRILLRVGMTGSTPIMP